MSCRGNCTQGRSACPHPVQCQPGKIEQALTDWGALASDDYTEPETKDLGLAPITREERLVIWLCIALGVAGIGSLVVSCAA